MLNDTEQGTVDMLDFSEPTHLPLSADDELFRMGVFERLKRILNYNEPFSESEEMIHELLSLYYRWKSINNNNPCVPGYGAEQLIVYSLVKLCFWSWIQNNQLICEILSCIYNCDHHFSVTFLHAFNHTEYLLPLWRWSHSPNEIKQYNIILYFVQHANISNLMFGGVRYIDLNLSSPMCVPAVTLAAMCAKPKHLLMLLRYGAVLQPQNHRNDLQYTISDWDVASLLRHLLRIMWSCLGGNIENIGDSGCIVSMTMQNTGMCLRILLRTLPIIQRGSLKFSISNFDREGLFLRITDSEYFISKLTEKGVIPAFTRRYFEPAELQQWCRCTIRRILNENWQLPKGIFLLNLPNMLKKYLNLSYD